ncbi:MAG: NAD(P)H-hydrate dehydratase [Sandaracinaceae bacterium]|nr:NAD(P)H-hydrate dehydratase [Sandaracinaceae bacterium]
MTRAQVRAVDRHAIDALAVPGIVLMENAGRGAFEVLVREHAGALGRVVLVGGPGQNGGDAWVVARHLLRLGHRPRAVLVVPSGDAAELRGDAATNWAPLAPLGVETHVLPPSAHMRLADLLADATLVVDGVFGTGLTRPIEGPFAEVVGALNAARAPVFALDLPSGVDADNGHVLGVAVRATTTVTFAAHKRGLHQGPGAQLAGDLHLADIGVPVHAVGVVDAPDTPDAPDTLGEAPFAALLQREDLGALVPPRARDAHKGTAGHVLLLGGDEGKTGALYLAGLGAQRAGAGLVTLGAPPQSRAVLEHKVVEIMTTELPGSAAALAALASGKGALVVGPGLGLGTTAKALVRSWAAELAQPVVLDADALTILANAAGGLEVLREAHGPRVLTPHPGEAARLLGLTSAEVQADRHVAAEALARRCGHVVALKGAGTIVASPDGGAWVCPYGTSAMGTGGTGDVLAGVIGALLGAGLGAVQAATAGVLWHALAGERAACGDRGLLASELAHALPGVLRDALV